MTHEGNLISRSWQIQKKGVGGWRNIGQLYLYVIGSDDQPASKACIKALHEMIESGDHNQLRIIETTVIVVMESGRLSNEIGMNNDTQ